MNPGTFHVNGPHIVAAVDGSDHSHAVVAWAIEEAQSRGACLRVVICRPTIAEVHVFGAGPSAHGIDPVDLAVVRDQAVGIVDDVRLRGEADPRGLDIDVRVHTGPPVEHLLALSEHAVLLVVGSRGSGSRSHGVIGSVATAVTRHAKCPVVVIP
jgi:nucleotide-binding universal stress UspA family protein